MNKGNNPDYTDPEFFVKMADDIVKNNSDLTAEQKKEIEDLGQQYKKASKNIGTHQTSWWRKKNKTFRIWVFSSVIWAIFVFLFVIVFDPFNNGSISYMAVEEFIQMSSVISIPFIAGGIKSFYDKYVK